MEAPMVCYAFPSGSDFSELSTSFMTGPESGEFDMDFDMSFSSFNAEQCLMYLESGNGDMFGMDEAAGWIEEYNDHSVASRQSTPVGSPVISSSSPVVSLSWMEDNAVVDQDMGVFHLLKGYGEARESGLPELAGVIRKRLGEKVTPIGSIIERLGHYLIQGSESSSSSSSSPPANYLVQEARKNFASAFRALYEICPFDRFAHFAANTAIMEAIPEDCSAVHIVEFNVEAGVQWPPLLAALGNRRAVRLTCIDSDSGDDSGNPTWDFLRTKDYLSTFAASMGLALKIESATLEQVKLEKSFAVNPREFLVFNCMYGLPHSGAPQCRAYAADFMAAADELILNSRSRGGSGILTLATVGSQTPFSDAHLLQSYAFFESLEHHFPPHLSQARTAMECLFVGPCISSIDEDALGSTYLERCRLSKQNVMEAEELVPAGSGQYSVEAAAGELVLEWKGTPLVRASAWR